ncbi:hypothetical protein [Streptomyces sp. NRRL B-1347]|uniref:hypothetical protein n=1 Tax=Streptomyces sp. NRRL B-1347 TaxID=1476877 RepID=UPI0004C93EAB|nr:hypothetical protein [Streptomyces sp. NRRL B-1347]
MPTDSPSPRQPSARKRGWCCCLPLALFPVVWLLAAALLPGEAGRDAGWWPIWVAAVVWNGGDGVGELLG